MLDAAAQPWRGLGDAPECLGDAPLQLGDVLRATVGEAALGERPNPLVGVEGRRVRGKVLDVQARPVARERAQRFALVGLRVIKQYDHVSAQVAQQMAQELADLGPSDVVPMKAIIQAQVPAPGTDRNAGDDRDLVAPGAMAVDRGLSARSPGAQHRGDQQEPRFVDKDEVGAQPGSVFFTRGHSLRFQCAIASSSRSSARRSGF